MYLKYSSIIIVQFARKPVHHEIQNKVKWPATGIASLDRLYMNGNAQFEKFQPIILPR